MRESRPIFVGREKAQFGTSSTDFVSSTDSTSSTGPILLAYDFFLNFWIRLSALSICLMDRLNFRLGLIHHWRIPPKIANRPMMANR